MSSTLCSVTEMRPIIWDFLSSAMEILRTGTKPAKQHPLYMVTQSQHFKLKWCEENNQVWLPRRTWKISERHKLWLTSLLNFKVTCPSLDKRDHICYQELKLTVKGSKKLLRTQYSAFWSDFLNKFKKMFWFYKGRLLKYTPFYYSSYHVWLSFSRVLLFPLEWRERRNF